MRSTRTSVMGKGDAEVQKGGRMMGGRMIGGSYCICSYIWRRRSGAEARDGRVRV